MKSLRGALIVVEGCDRSGKTTQCKKLVSALNNCNIPAEYMNFPDRSTPVGHLVNDYLTKKEDFSDKSIHLMFSANRWELASRIENKISQGTTLVVDRYAYSGVAFSAIKPGMDLDWCKHPDAGLPKPDLVLLLTLSPAAMESRPGYGDERYERAEIQEKVFEVFRSMKDDTWKEIDANKTVEELHEELLIIVKEQVEKSKSLPLERRKNLMEKKDISAAYHRPSGPSQDCRRIRLWDQNNAKKMHYISMNSCNSPRANELRQLKDEIIAKIATIDNEINQIKQAFENCLNKVKMVKDKLKKKRALSENGDQSTRYQSTASRIYAENKKKAEDFEKSFRNLNMNIKLQLPIDERIIDGILDLTKERHCAFKDKLKKHLLEKKNAMDIERKQMEETFCKNMVNWKKRIEKIESSEEWKQGADECRKFFEKEFPDITVKECTENRDSNSEVRMEDMILNAAAIPPLLDSHLRKLRYRDTNNFVGDFPKEYRERNQSYWANEEKKIFKEQYLLHPKKFGVISSFLKNKSANDCIQYYYHSKKDENYKRLLRRSRKRKTSSSLYDEPEEAYLNSIAGVITRQQRTQILKELHEKKSKFETSNALSAVKESDSHFLKVTKTKSLILEGDASMSSKYSHAS